jgi:hypothetical protein
MEIKEIIFQLLIQTKNQNQMQLIITIDFYLIHNICIIEMQSLRTLQLKFEVQL